MQIRKEEIEKIVSQSNKLDNDYCDDCGCSIYKTGGYTISNEVDEDSFSIIDTNIYCNNCGI